MVDDLIAKNSRLVNLLWSRGYFPQYGSGAEALTLLDVPTFQQALGEFQILTGQIATEEEAEIRFCALPDRAPVRSGICKWPMLDVTLHSVGALGTIGAADFKASMMEAAGYWADVCAIRPVYSPNPKTAHIILHAANLGGAGSVLADSTLPCGATPSSQVEQRYDSENWVISETPTGNQIDLQRVICHELGHGLIGTDHIADGNLMAPMYSRKIRKPQAGDISVAVGRYGQKPPAPPAGPQQKISISFEWDAVTGKMLSGSATGARVTKLS